MQSRLIQFICYYCNIWQNKRCYTYCCWEQWHKKSYSGLKLRRCRQVSVQGLCQTVKKFSVTLTLNLLPTLMKLSLPALCLESLVVLEFSNSSRTNLSFDSHTKLSKDMWRASLFFSTNRVCGRMDKCIHSCSIGLLYMWMCVVQIQISAANMYFKHTKNLFIVITSN